MSDLIDRQAAIDALETTKRIASYELHGGEVLRTFNVVLNSLINIMSLLPPANNSEIPNSSDTISRQAAIDAVKEAYENDEMFDGYEYRLQELPSAQPEIIHCGECTKMEVDSVFHDCWCGETGKKVWINHYCGYADRREEKR